jgi:uncharacterized membrane protein/protein-disulfide isomerase
MSEKDRTEQSESTPDVERKKLAPDTIASRAGSTYSQNSHSESAIQAFLPARPHLPTLFFAVLGLLTASYVFFEFVRIKTSRGLGVGCFIKSDTTCGGVVASGYGTIMGIPIGALTMAFWSVVAVIAFLPKIQSISRSAFLQVRAIVSFVGFLYILWLFYLSEFVGEISCIICSLMQIMVTLFFLYSTLVLMFRNFGGGRFGRVNFQSLAVVVLLAFVPFLALGGGFSMYMKFVKSRSVNEQPLGNLEDAFPREWWSVQAGDTEGNGEDYRAGNDKAPINVQLFTDPTSEDAWRVQAAVGEAMNRLGGDKALFVIKFLPFDANCNRYAEDAGQACLLSVAVRCAGRQGRFFEMLNWEYQMQLKPILERSAYSSTAGLRYQAERFGMNGSEFALCLDSTIELVKIREDVENAKKMGAETAPFLLINGTAFEGDMSDSDALLAEFARVLK